MTREPLQQALNALESAEWLLADLSPDGTVRSTVNKAIDALRSALAAPQPEPIALSDLVKVGALVTVNSDPYPDLGAYWVQLRTGPEFDDVLARVYGDTPEETRVKAERIAALLNSSPPTAAAQPVWPTMPPSKNQSPVLFEDGYAEGYARCLRDCKEAFASPAAPQPPESIQCGDYELPTQAQSEICDAAWKQYSINRSTPGPALEAFRAAWFASKAKQSTSWFAGDQKPSRKGVYERDYGEEDGLWFCGWDGVVWLTGCKYLEDVKRCYSSAASQNLPWREIAAAPTPPALSDAEIEAEIEIIKQERYRSPTSVSFIRVDDLPKFARAIEKHVRGGK